MSIIRRIFTIIVLASLVLRPLPSFAQETTPDQEMPVYFFISPQGEVLGVVELSPSVLLGCATQIPTSNEAEKSVENPQVPDCALWDASTGTITPISEEGAGVQHDLAGARYYKSNVGKFISQDPLFWNIPGELLSDPQQLNAYSYGRNNPLVFKDPTGKYIEWGSREVKNFGWGTHPYTRIGVTDATRPFIDFAGLGIPADTNEFTIGFYNDGSGYLVSEIYYAGRDGAPDAAKDFYGVGGKEGSYRVAGQTPEEEADAINMMGGAAVDFNDRSFDYKILGVNSQSGNRTLAEMAGLGSQYKNFQPPGINYGRGFTLPPSSFNSSYYQQLANIAGKIADLQKQVDAFVAQQNRSADRYTPIFRAN